jgi:hypothetical protein
MKSRNGAEKPATTVTKVIRQDLHRRDPPACCYGRRRGTTTGISRELHYTIARSHDPHTPGSETGQGTPDLTVGKFCSLFDKAEPSNSRAPNDEDKRFHALSRKWDFERKDSMNNAGCHARVDLGSATTKRLGRKERTRVPTRLSQLASVQPFCVTSFCFVQFSAPSASQSSSCALRRTSGGEYQRVASNEPQASENVCVRAPLPQSEKPPSSNIFSSPTFLRSRVSGERDLTPRTSGRGRRTASFGKNDMPAVLADHPSMRQHLHFSKPSPSHAIRTLSDRCFSVHNEPALPPTIDLAEWTSNTTRFYRNIIYAAAEPSEFHVEQT